MNRFWRIILGKVCLSNTHTHRYYSFCWPAVGAIWAQGCPTFIRSVYSSPFFDNLSINSKTAVCNQHMEGSGTENIFLLIFFFSPNVGHHLNSLLYSELHYLNFTLTLLSLPCWGFWLTLNIFRNLNTSLGLEDQPHHARRTVRLVRSLYLCIDKYSIPPPSSSLQILATAP